MLFRNHFLAEIYFSLWGRQITNGKQCVKIMRALKLDLVTVNAAKMRLHIYCSNLPRWRWNVEKFCHTGSSESSGFIHWQAVCIVETKWVSHVFIRCKKCCLIWFCEIIPDCSVVLNKLLPKLAFKDAICKKSSCRQWKLYTNSYS